MNVYRLKDKIFAKKCEQFHNGHWKEKSLMANSGIVLTDISDEEHDGILNISDGLDPHGLRGYCITLKVNNSDGKDPMNLDLLVVPKSGMVLENAGRYYMVHHVVQSTKEPYITAYVHRMSEGEQATLTFSGV